jgi:two-component system, NarL family, sensor histidine kinase DegS
MNLISSAAVNIEPYPEVWSVYSQSVIPTALVRRDGQILICNEAMVRLTGYTHEEMPDLDTWTLKAYPDEDYRKRVIETSVKSRLRELDVKRSLSIITRKDGQRRYVRFSVYDACGEDQSEAYQIVQAEDVTEVHLAELRLKESEKRYRQLVETLSEGILVIDISGVITFANLRIGQLLKCHTEELLGKPLSLYLAGTRGDSSHVDSCLRNKGGPSCQSLDVELLCQDGTHLYAIATIAPFPGTGEDGVIMSVLDISERRKAENYLRESREELRGIFQSASDGIIVTDLDSIIRHANQQAGRIHGFRSAQALVGKNTLDLVAPHDRPRADGELKKLLKRGLTKRMEYDLVKADGALFRGELSTSVIRDADKSATGFVVISRDVTEQRRLRDNLQSYVSHITMAQEEERKRISRELHDETVQSLSIVALELQGLISEKGLPERFKPRVAHLSSTTAGVLEEVRRISYGLRPGLLESLGLAHSLGFLVSDLQVKNGVKCELELRGLDRQLPPDTEVSLFRIAQEALQNVVRHSRAKSATCKVSYGKQKVKLQISDNGVGFGVPDVLGDLAVRGSLGILGMQERAHLINATFNIRSVVGKGTKITIEAPIAP